MDTRIAEIKASVARLEVASEFIRKDLSRLYAQTTAHQANQELRLGSLERSRATFKGWGKGLGVLGVVSAIAGFFGLD